MCYLYRITCVHNDGMSVIHYGDSLTLLLRVVKADSACVRACLELREGGKYRAMQETDLLKCFPHAA